MCNVFFQLVCAKGDTNSSYGDDNIFPTKRTRFERVDIKKTGMFDVHPVDDINEPWASDADHRTGWNKEFKSGTYRGMLYGSVCDILNKLYHWPRESVLANWARTRGGLASAGA